MSIYPNGLTAQSVAKIALREFDISVQTAEIVGHKVVCNHCLIDITYNDLVQLIDESL